MKIYQRQGKSTKGPGNFFFGDYGEIPISVSLTIIGKNNVSKSKDTRHLHKEGHEFYFTIDGKAIIEIEGKEVILDKNHLIMVEPGEKHFVKKILEMPFSVLTICTVKKKSDKVMIK